MAVLSGTRAAQPAAGSVSVGQLYRVEDEGFILERSTGSEWVRQAPGGYDHDVFFNGYVYNFLPTEPGVFLQDLAGAVDARAWAVTASAAQIAFTARSDHPAWAVQTTGLTIARNGDVTVGRNLTVAGGSGVAVQVNESIGLEIAAAGAYYRLRDTGESSGSRLWDIGLASTRLKFWAMDDADLTGVEALALDRVGRIYEQGRTAALGHWTDHAYNGGDYTAAGAMTITVDSGDVFVNRWTLIGNTLIWTVQLATFTLGGVASQYFYLTLPGGITTLAQGVVPAAYYNDGAAVLPAIVSAASGSQVLVQRADGANHVLGTNNHYLYFTFIGSIT